MREYELAFIVSPELDETPTSELVEKIEGWITDAGGIIEKKEVQGRKKFSYVINKMKEGQYFLFEIKLPPAEVAPLERRLQLEEFIMRYMTLKLE